jgi:transposase
VAQDPALTETAVRARVKPADLGAGTRSDGLTSAERAEMARLRKELRETREEGDSLKERWLSSLGRYGEYLPAH